MRFICDETMPLGVFSPIYESFKIDEKNCKNEIQIRTMNGILNYLDYLIYFLINFYILLSIINKGKKFFKRKLKKFLN